MAFFQDFVWFDFAFLPLLTKCIKTGKLIFGTGGNFASEWVADLLRILHYKDLAYKIVGCFYNVYNELGPGFKESIYQKALEIEFNLQNISYEEEKRILIKYKSKNAGYYTPDFIVDKKIIVEIKAVDIMPKLYETQLYYYLRGTHYKLGYIINFGGPKIDIRRRIYETARKISVQILAKISV